jgi:hypothetical protein
MPATTTDTGPTWVTIDEGDRLGIVFPTDDGGTELIYIIRNLEDRVLRILDGGGDLAEDPSDLFVRPDFPAPNVADRPLGNTPSA